MAEKRPSESSSEEPASKKQAISNEMYKELKAKIAELEKRNSELEKRNSELEKRDSEAQELTQIQIEKFQERTAEAEEKIEMYKNTTVLPNCFLNSNISKDYLNYLNSDSKNRLSIIHHRFLFQISRYFIPGKPINEGLWLYNKQKIKSQYMIENGKCSICKTNKAEYGYKDDNIKFPFKIGAVKIDKVLVPSVGLEEEIRFESICNTLCKECILKSNLENTTYVESDKKDKSN
tara:strand:+ start:1036 stop:1737 length:702 start_codon:yes stop_codon:yes gene_type:complete